LRDIQIRLAVRVMRHGAAAHTRHQRYRAIVSATPAAAPDGMAPYPRHAPGPRGLRRALCMVAALLPRHVSSHGDIVRW
jgi:hypothetical protein